MKEKIFDILFVKPSHLTIKYLAKNNLIEYSKNVDEQLRISNILIYFYSCIILFFIEDIPKEFYNSSFFIVSILFILFYVFLSNKITKSIKHNSFKKLLALFELITNAINPIFIPTATLLSSIPSLNVILIPFASICLLIIILISIYLWFLEKYLFNNKYNFNIKDN